MLTLTRTPAPRPQRPARAAARRSSQRMDIESVIDAARLDRLERRYVTPIALQIALARLIADALRRVR